ncbi:AI-2E family transporter [Comamonas odontotermitis]|uniref:AI-2E family transporter n=1 Tax=Comamonas odontotermitis TaxID=379895 RepID=UPI0016202223|nr:AI-2E family transporter [Comamonas odontotermitis]
MLNTRSLHDKAFILLLIAVTIAFFAVLFPFQGAVFWGVIFAVVFTPLHKKIAAKFPKYPTIAALITLSLCLVLVILPLILLSISLAKESAAIYERVHTGQMNFGQYFQQIYNALPQWLIDLLARFNLNDPKVIQEKISGISVQASQFVATKVLAIGQNTMGFLVSFCIMLYLLFFFLRDGKVLVRKIYAAVPLDDSHKQKLGAKFITVVRATVKGNLAVAATQGALGGIIFWILDIDGALLWGVVMAFLSLLPAVGAAIVWAPVAIYFLATGANWQGIVLAAYGAGVMGMVDNILRPLLVGKDTKMPDYLILISTLGGLSLFGLTGFVIGPLIAALFIAVWDLFAPQAQIGVPADSLAPPDNQN